MEPLPPSVWVSDPKYGFLPGVILNHAEIFKTPDGEDKTQEDLEHLLSPDDSSAFDLNLEVGILKASAVKAASQTARSAGLGGGGKSSMRPPTARMSLGSAVLNNSSGSLKNSLLTAQQKLPTSTSMRGPASRMSLGGHQSSGLNSIPKTAGCITVGGCIFQRTDFAETRNLNARTEMHLLRSRCGDPKDAEKTFHDCASLYFLHDAGILENVRLRFNQDQIYTYTSSVLLAVNPYKQIDSLYTEEVKKSYYKLPSLHSQPPHPYAIGDLAYRKMLNEKADQAILISGESGAGKTQSAKIVMGFLVEHSRCNDEFGTTDPSLSLDNLIMKCATPILESLGNATTIRNNNSSRFGKFNSLVFNARGDLVGGEIRTYLLESSRVAIFSARERTYHIFYEMLFGYGSDMKAKLGLVKDRKYAIMYGHPNSETYNSSPKRPVAEEIENFESFKHGLRVMRMCDEDIEGVFQVLAGLVHLFELEFEEVEGSFGQGVKVIECEHIEWAAKLLGMQDHALTESLCKKTVIRKKKDGRESIFKTDRSKPQAEQAKQALVKMLYKRLFDEIVGKINQSLLVAGQSHGDMAGTSFGPLAAPTASFAVKPSSAAFSSRRQIGILDIYGFEQLKTNSFEQLCINLANERLQDFFREKVIVAEQEMYLREGLPLININISSAEPLLDSIAETLRILDKQGEIAQKGVRTTDQKFTEEVHKNCGKFMQKIKRGRKFAAVSANLDAALSFTVQHYAGEVSYSTCGWLEKNNSTLSIESEMIIFDSSSKLVRSLSQNALGSQRNSCEEEEDSFLGKGDVSNASVAKKYLEDLERLIVTLSACSLHYIRTFKPNLQQKPAIFEGGIVLDQMLQSGSVDLVKIMHEGYPNRLDFHYLQQRYQSQLEEFKDEQPRMFLEALMIAFDVPEDQYCMGMSKLFLKSGCLAVLDKLTEADPITGESKGIPPEVKKKLARYLLRKKCRRCLHVVRVCNWLPRFLRKAKLEGNQLKLLQCTLTYLRAHRWAERIRDKFRRQRVDDCVMKLQKVTKLARSVKIWLDKARHVVEIRRRKAKAEENLKLCFDLYPRIAKALKTWIGSRREGIRHKVEEAERAKTKRKILDKNLNIFCGIAKFIVARGISGCGKTGKCDSKIFTLKDHGLLQKRRKESQSILQAARSRLRLRALTATFWRRVLLNIHLRRFLKSKKNEKANSSEAKKCLLDKNSKLLWHSIRAFVLWRRSLMKIRANKKKNLDTKMQNHKFLKHLCRMTVENVDC